MMLVIIKHDIANNFKHLHYKNSLYFKLANSKDRKKNEGGNMLW